MAAITGLEQRATEVRQAWKVEMWSLRWWEWRAASGGGVEGVRFGSVEKAVVSRPEVKARGPAPERMMARMDGVVERAVKRVDSSCHMLGEMGQWLGGGGGLERVTAR